MEICQCLVLQFELVLIFKFQMKLWKFRYIQVECQDVFVDQVSFGYFVEMFFNEDRVFEGIFCRFVWVFLVVLLLGDIEFFFFDVDEYIGKKIVFKFLLCYFVFINVQSVI